MARVKRELSSTSIYHVMIRGNEKKKIFFDDDDRLRFVEILIDRKKVSKYDLYAYCLMDNHVHLLIKERVESIANIMKRINVSYAYYFNRKYNRIGHVFQDRFRSESVDNENYLLAVTRYIHNNPKKANTVNNLRNYKWSSYNIYLNEISDELVDDHFVLGLFSNDIQEARKLFLTFSTQETNDDYLDIEEDNDLSNIEITGLLNAKIYLNNFLATRNIDKDKLKESPYKNERNMIITHLKSKSDLSVRDMARLLEIDRGVINRVKI